jgi:hypothetical protein
LAEPLTLAPPTLYTLFPEATTLDDKAFKFLECKYENGSNRRVAKILGIDHKTVKSIYEFLLETEVGIRFNLMLAEQTEDFYSKKTLTNLFEAINKKIAAIDLEIATHKGDDWASYRLKLIAEHRQWTMKLLDATLACRPITEGVRKQDVDEKYKTLQDQYKDLLDDGDSLAIPHATISTVKLSS